MTDAPLCAFMDHPVADLLRRPTVLQTGHDVLAQLWISKQFALSGSPPLCTLMRCHPEVSCVLFGESIIGPEITFDLAKDRRSYAASRHVPSL
jgi:hypothetical protein